MTLRLDPALAEQLEAVAEVEGRAIAEVVREAISDHVARRKKDPTFVRLLEENLARHRRLLRALED